MDGGVCADRTVRYGVAVRMGDELDGSTGGAVIARTKADETFLVGVGASIDVVCVPAHFYWGGEGVEEGEKMGWMGWRRKGSGEEGGGREG